MSELPHKAQPWPDTAGMAAALRAGEAGAEDQLISRFRRGLVAVMRARTHDAHAAEELADDTLLAVIGAVRNGRLRDVDRLAGFVHGVGKNMLASYYRRRASEPPTVALDEKIPAPRPADPEARERRQTALWAAAQLSSDHRQILELTLDGLTPQEIAERLGLAPETVRMRKMRALQRATRLVQEQLRRRSGAWPNG